jgi:hypothetical protein
MIKVARASAGDIPPNTDRAGIERSLNNRASWIKVNLSAFSVGTNSRRAALVTSHRT